MREACLAIDMSITTSTPDLGALGVMTSQGLDKAIDLPRSAQVVIAAPLVTKGYT